MKTKKGLTKKLIMVIGSTIIIVLMLICTAIMLSRNGIIDKLLAENKKAAEEQKKIEMTLEIKEIDNVTGTLKCLLMFTANDENEKIKSIEYPIKEGETEPSIITIADKDGEERIAIDYDIEEGKEDQTFKITTTIGNEYKEKTGYSLTYYKDDGEVFLKKSKLKAATTSNVEATQLTIESSYPEKDGYHFLGWSANKDSNIADYFENGTITRTDEDIDLYAIWTTQKNGYAESIENDSLIGKVSKINTSGVQNIDVNGVTYSANVIVINNDLVLDGTKEVAGATLVDKVYSFGNKAQDVATKDVDAQNMVILKVNGNLTINNNVKLTACKSDDGYGGPKGLFIYATGTFANNGSIDMTARGARAQGQDVYLWKNVDNTYEYVPAAGGTGGVAVYNSNNGYGGTVRHTAGKAGENGINRQTGGGGSGGTSQEGNHDSGTSGKGGNGTSYSGGTGGGGICSTKGSKAEAGSDIGGKGGKGVSSFASGGARKSRRCQSKHIWSKRK